MKGEFQLKVAEAAGAKVVEALSDICYRIVIAGSIRRWNPIVGDVDIVAVPWLGNSSVPMAMLQERFGASEGSKVQTQIEVDGVSVDVWLVPRKSWGAALLFVTGSAMFNIGCRTLAKNRGFKLSRYALVRRDDESVVIAQQTEEEVLNALGMKFIPPEERSVDSLGEFFNLVKKYDLNKEVGEMSTAGAILYTGGDA